MSPTLFSLYTEELAVRMRRINAGPDEIPYEMYKNGGETVIERMTDVFNRVWREECRKSGMNVE